ncbi:hypothetical protein AB7M37_004944 [Sinorhizobium fredii]
MPNSHNSALIGASRIDAPERVVPVSAWPPTKERTKGSVRTTSMIRLEWTSAIALVFAP